MNATQHLSVLFKNFIDTTVAPLEECSQIHADCPVCKNKITIQIEDPRVKEVINFISIHKNEIINVLVNQDNKLIEEENSLLEKELHTLEEENNLLKQKSETTKEIKECFIQLQKINEKQIELLEKQRQLQQLDITDQY